MKARFVYKKPDARLVRNAIDRGEGQVAEYIVERIIYLPKEKFIHFRSHLLEDNDAIMTYKNEMYVDDNKVWHVLMFCSMIADIMILVNSEGFNYARYCSIICNGGEQVEKRYSTGQRYPARPKSNRRRTTAAKYNM